MTHDITHGLGLSVAGGSRESWWQGGNARVVLPGDILVTEPDDAAFAKLAALSAVVRRVPLEDAAAAGIVFVALHPPVLGPGLATLRPCLVDRGHRDVARAEDPAERDGDWRSEPTRVARMIPNAPSIIGRGYNPVTFGTGIDSDARAALAPLFTPWGDGLRSRSAPSRPTRS